MKTKHFSMKSVISMLLALVIIAGTLPVSVFAAQSNEYVDPADSWLSSNNRTNELDVNATITNETQYCNVCKKHTSVLAYRVPEYTKTGETALNRGVRYSDGTCIDGVSKGNLDNGTPGVDAYYTGYHFTKVVCQTCGTINSGDGPTDYNFNNNVYSLNSCDHNFFLDFDATTYEPYDESRHLTTLKRGEYCKFCKGTFARASRGLESHDFTESVDAQLGNNRFYVAEKCDDCGYETSEYVTAKSVVASYYGIADGEAHTLTVSDISDSGVKTSIRYGNSADNCTTTSAPNYTQAGYYTVYYKINYSYAGETMTENGVSYVWLVNNDDSDSNDTIIVVPPAHEHDYHYLETVPPSCENLGYDRFQCNGCGNLIKTNYTPSTGHTYKTVTVLNKADNTPVKDMEVIVSELPTTDAEPKVLKDKTNEKGMAVYPPLSEDVTDDNGDSGVTEEKPGKGEDTDGDGVEDKPGEVETTSYIVKVNDTKDIITGAFIEIKNGKVYVTLPETHSLTTSNQTTVTVLDKDSKPVQNVDVTVKDKTTEKSATTNSNGQITVPVKTSSGGGGGSSSGGSSGGGGYSISTVNVKVTDRDGKTVTVSKSTGTDKITLTLLTGKDLSKNDNYYTITVTDRNGKAKTDYTVILKDKNKNEISGKTDDEGILILPAKEHKAYIVGYNDGTFRADNDMTRAEAAAIFARLIAEAKGESISEKASFKDVDKNEWYAGYVGYLEKYDVINGYNDGTFKPDASVTRAEFVAMTVRYYDLFNDVNKTGNTLKYTDVENSYWAYSDIAFAKNIGWLNGYSDGSFRGDNDITRAEVVTVVNRATGRVADKEYVKDNFTKLNRFTDVSDSNMWYFFDVAESCNDHKSVTSASSEVWVK